MPFDILADFMRLEKHELTFHGETGAALEKWRC